MTNHENPSFKLPNEKTLIVVAHADDESVFHGGYLQNLVSQDPNNAHVIAAAASGEASTVDLDEESSRTVANGGRLKEFSDALNYWGVPDDEDHRIALKLPDGELHEPDNIHLLTNELVNQAEGLGISIFVTSGRRIDGHSDHAAVDIASILAARELRKQNKDIQVLGLSNWGGIVIPITEELRRRKREAWLIQKSQANEERIDRIVNESEPYRRLMQQEERYRRYSTLDVGRAMFRLAVPPKRRIPKI